MNIEKIQGYILKMTQDKKKLTLAIICVILILYIDLSFILGPNMRAVSALNNKIIKIKNDLKNFKTDLAQMQASLSRPVTLKTKKIIAEGELSWLTEEIYKLGNQYNVKITQIKPIKETKPSLSAGKSLPFSLNIDMSCGYDALIKFLKDLDNHSVFMAIDELDIRRSDKDIFFQQVKLTLRTVIRR